MKEVLLLLSGGIDSTTLLADLCNQNKQVHALSFDYGQRHLQELSFAKMNALFYGVLSHHIIKIDLGPASFSNMLTNHQITPVNYKETPLKYTPNETYVPGRNLIMLSYAAAYAEANSLRDIYFAANADDGQHFPDCRELFISALNQLWTVCPNTSDIKVNTPYIKLSKSEVIQKSNDLKVNLQHTLSCYAPISNKECGTCQSCILKQEAIKKLI